MKLLRLLEMIGSNPRCRLLPRTDSAVTLSPNHLLPNDVAEFYRHCGGAELFNDAAYPTIIVPPGGVVLANPVIRDNNDDTDISASWYIIAHGEDGPAVDAITIDLSPIRNGRCYCSFWDVHAIAGSSPIIAANFTELLDRLVEAAGHSLFWVNSSFKNRRDAYDESGNS
jgi:hypothetical protein